MRFIRYGQVRIATRGVLELFRSRQLVNSALN
jgi:hypothetical protein